jgi:hypothetical protein
MTELMHPLLQGDPHPLKGSLEELPPHSRLPRLDLAIDWESPQEEFLTSARAFFTGPKAPKNGDLAQDRALRVDWVEGKLPGKAFLAACLWHGIAVWLLILPIWGFLPQTRPTLAPVQIEYDVYDPPDLPKILLPNAKAKPSPPPKKPNDASNEPVQKGADAYHPRQTIVSIPVKVTHPRQTLIQPPRRRKSSRNCRISCSGRTTSSRSCGFRSSRRPSRRKSSNAKCTTSPRPTWRTTPRIPDRSILRHPK